MYIVSSVCLLGLWLSASNWWKKVDIGMILQFCMRMYFFTAEVIKLHKLTHLWASLLLRLAPSGIVFLIPSFTSAFNLMNFELCC